MKIGTKNSLRKFNAFVKKINIGGNFIFIITVFTYIGKEVIIIFSYVKSIQMVMNIIFNIALPLTILWIFLKIIIFFLELFIKPDIQIRFLQEIGTLFLGIVNNEDVNLLEPRFEVYKLKQDNMDILEGLINKVINLEQNAINNYVPHNSDYFRVNIAFCPYNNMLIFNVNENNRYFKAMVEDSTSAYSCFEIGLNFSYKLDDEKKYRNTILPVKRIKLIHHKNNTTSSSNVVILDSLSWER